MQSHKIAKLCSRWDACSVNNCPLEPEYPNLITDPNDKEKACTVEKGVRTRAAAKFPGILKYGGLTTREWAGKQRYDALTPAVKSQMAERGRERLKAVAAAKMTKK